MSQQPPDDKFYKDPTRDLTDEEVAARATQLFEEPELDSLAKELIAAGWDVFWRKPPFGKSRYFQAHKDGNFAYVELNIWGFTLSTKHVPHQRIGTGFTVKREVGSLSVEDVEYAAKVICPSPFEEYRSMVIKYGDFRNFLKHNGWSPLYYVLVRDGQLIVGRELSA